MSAGDLLNDIFVKNFAEKKGISLESAKKILLSMQKKDQSQGFDESMAHEVEGISKFVKTFNETTDGVPEPLKTSLSLMASDVLMSDGRSRRGQGETLEEHVEGLKKMMIDLRVIDQYLPDKNAENKPHGNGEDSAKLIASAMGEAMKPMTDTLSIIRDQMDQSKKDDMTTLIETLNGNIEKLAAGKASADGGKTTPFEMVNEVKKFTEEMVGSLGVMGFKVSKDTVTSQEVQDRIATALDGAKKRILEEMASNPQEFTEVLKQKGYRITGGPMKWEDVQKLLEVERKKIIEEANEDVRIKELGGIIREAVGGFMSLFQPIVGKWFEEGIDAQAEETKGKTGQDVEGDVINEEVKRSSVPPTS